MYSDKTSGLFLGMLLGLVLFSACSNDDPVNCDPAFSITGIYPAQNPPLTPVLLEGELFSAETQVYFDQFPAETEFVDSKHLVAYVPAELNGNSGPAELNLKDGSCETTVSFNVLESFFDRYRANPPFIHFPDESKKVDFDIGDFFNGSYRRLVNIWGFNQVFDIRDQVSIRRDSIGFEGFEFIESFQFRENTLFGTFDLNSDRFYFKINYDDQFTSVEEPLPGDELEGAVYFDRIQTPKGEKEMEYLFLQSRITGRQYLFELFY